MDNAAASYRFALACASQLAASGVRFLVTSPGFRNSPLILAAHKTAGMEVVSAVDERGGAFLALGLSRSQRAPVALLCTSGTAVGNYFPAVMEASHGRVPLVILTGDRPQELVGTGANQCADQSGLFGRYVRLFVDTAPPSGAGHEIRHAGYAVGKAVARALQPVPGPVHLNLRFREPFLPSGEECERIEAEERPRAWSFLGSSSGPDDEQAMAIGSMLRAAKRPLLALGAGCHGQRLLGRLADLSAERGIPIVAEAASGLAFSEHAGRAPHMLRTEAALAAMASGALQAPDLLIRVGGPLTGRAYGRLLSASALPQLVLDEWGEAREPGLHPSIMVEGNLEAWLGCGPAWAEAAAESAWVESLLSFDAGEEDRLESRLRGSSAFTEWHFHRLFGRLLGPGACLLLGNSMPIRDFNSVFPRERRRMRVFSNRGLSGIDGLIATAAGLAFGSGEETHAVLGDLSTLHDLPSLSLLSSLRESLSLTLWIMNNGGGEIFRIVQTAKTGGSREWFTTPQSFDLSALAKTFRLSYSRVHDTASLEALAPEGFSGRGVRLVEVLVDGPENLSIRRPAGDES